ncbi:MAG: hypothetical protein NKF70_06040 [Methanobacterium sp. ERen5]|nr:MAG: hypothetical protein NKF70_06040 [Methanobacterium sp. ERen5]
MVEDSQIKEEESELTADSSSNSADESETGSEISGKASDSEPKNGSDGDTETKSSSIEKQEGVKSESDQTSNHDNDPHDDHAINFHELMDNGLFKSIRSRKDQILRYVAVAIGVILIIYGIVIISASVTKVADNVIFGEGASFAAFSMLLGFLIIVGAFSQKILNKTFLKNINSELEIAEGKTEAANEKTEDINGKKDPNKLEDGKDNIVGEDKK